MMNTSPNDAINLKSARYETGSCRGHGTALPSEKLKYGIFRLTEAYYI